MTPKSQVLCTLLLLSLGSCRATREVQSDSKQFEPIEEETFRQEDPNRPLRATKAASLKPSQIHTNNVAYEPLESGEKTPVNIEVSFSDLSEPQFDALKKLYAGPFPNRSRVTYKPNASLSDFLPPVMQALENHRFINQSESVRRIFAKNARNIEAIETGSNCWSTVYSLLRSAMQQGTDPGVLELFYVGQQPALAVLNQFTRPIEVLRPFEGEKRDDPEIWTKVLPKISQEKIAVGDILLVTEIGARSKRFLHAAMMVEENLYFQKDDSQSSRGYNFADIKRIIHEFSSEAINFQNFQLEWVRTNGKTPASVKDAFAGNRILAHEGVPTHPDQPTVVIEPGKKASTAFRIADIPILLNEVTKRGELDPGSLHADYFYVNRDDCGRNCRRCFGAFTDDDNGFKIGYSIDRVSPEMPVVYAKITHTNKAARIKAELTPYEGLPLSQVSTGEWKATLDGEAIRFKLETTPDGTHFTLSHGSKESRNNYCK